MGDKPRGEQPLAAAGGGAGSTRVAIIEDRREIREGLQMLINGTDSYRCTGTYRSMEEALSGIGSDVPDVVLVDIGLPGMSGIEGIALLKARYPDLLLLMLTVYDDDDRIFDALCAGACGYLLKRTPPARLLEYLKEACPAARRFRRRSRGAWSPSSGRSARRTASITS
jgi:DNA-binding NarL/FixJ family response regulator